MVTTRAAYRTTRAVCEHCGIKFKAYRVTAKYCCESCKQRAKRERGFRTAVQAARELVRAEIQVLPEDPNRCRSCGHTGIARDAVRPGVRRRGPRGDQDRSDRAVLVLLEGDPRGRGINGPSADGSPARITGLVRQPSNQRHATRPRSPPRRMVWENGAFGSGPCPPNRNGLGGENTILPSPVWSVLLRSMSSRPLPSSHRSMSDQTRATASERRRPQSRRTSTRAMSTTPRRAARPGLSMPRRSRPWATGPLPGWPPRRHPAAPEPERPAAGSGGTDRTWSDAPPRTRWASPFPRRGGRLRWPTPPAGPWRSQLPAPPGP